MIQQHGLKRSTLSLVGTAALLLGTCLVGCRGESKPPAEPPPTPVTVAKPVVMPIVEWDEYTGRLDAIDQVEIRARVSGYLRSIHFDEGVPVQRGDLLAVIDQRPFEAALSSAEARLKEAEAKKSESKAMRRQAEAVKADREAQLTLTNQRLERARKLARSNAIAQEELDERASEQLQAEAALEASQAAIESAIAAIATAEASIETARANVQSAELDLSYTEIRAPISGVISRRYITEGNLISGGSAASTLLTTIVSIDPIHVYFDADEQAFLKYARLSREGKRESSRDVKNPVYLQLINETGFPHLGHMDFVDNQIDPNTGTIRGRAIFRNEDQSLTPGLFAEVRLPGSGKYEAVLIPDAAIGADQSERFVYLIDDQNTVVRKPVELGPTKQGLRIIRSGLDGTERVITRGLQRVAAGSKVDPKVESVEPSDNADDGLPNDYEPVPPEQWINRDSSQPAEASSEQGGMMPHPMSPSRREPRSTPMRSSAAWPSLESNADEAAEESAP
jgi:RND family efflux transporter MFP subunit